MSAAHRKRLRPGELDSLVLSYLCQHMQDGPLTATAVAKGLGGRSAGAVSNCLARLAKAKKVRLTKKAPRAYVAKTARAR